MTTVKSSGWPGPEHFTVKKQLSGRHFHVLNSLPACIHAVSRLALATASTRAPRHVDHVVQRRFGRYPAAHFQPAIRVDLQSAGRDDRSCAARCWAVFQFMAFADTEKAGMCMQIFFMSSELNISEVQCATMKYISQKKFFAF